MSVESKRPRKTWWLWPVIAVGAAIAVWYFGQPAIGTFEGDRAPDFTVEDLSGETLNLSSLRGKPVFVNFWATWCLPCLEEMPEIQALYEKNPGAFHVVAISDEPRNTVVRYLEDFDYTFPIYLDRRGEVGRSYLVRAMPTSIFIDEQGIIRARHIGQLSGPEMEEYLQTILDERV